ncbi:hypothetical protein DRI50_01510 [candidate division KSB1 bacterium]|nr:MAG: hypothetical protein DRI50_01510 [candidate division KSB1 bacterium]
MDKEHSQYVSINGNPRPRDMCSHPGFPDNRNGVKAQYFSENLALPELNIAHRRVLIYPASKVIKKGCPKAAF